MAPRPSIQTLTRAVQRCFACDGMAHCHVLGAGRSGVPFSGDESGRRFEALLAVAGLRREDVFVTNAVLCNPLDASGNNRRPTVREVRACLPHLRAQIEAVDPDYVVALGGVALDALGRIEDHGTRLGVDCGTPRVWFGRRLIALYHPGRRAIVHRSIALQEEDWQRLGDMVRVLVGAHGHAPLRLVVPPLAPQRARTLKERPMPLSGAAGVMHATK